MDTIEASLYFIVKIVFTVLGLLLSGFLLAVLTQQRSVRKLRKVTDEEKITTLENERERIAADIHDELGTLLIAAKLQYSAVEVISEEDKLLLDRGHKLVDECINKIREIAKGLMPSILLYKGSVKAITEMINQLNKTQGLLIDFEPHSIPDLSHKMALHVFRILQEIVHNTIRHANAAHLKIIMYQDRGKLYISTVDDGQGFVHRTMKHNGLGMYNIHSRADMLNGHVHIQSKPGVGTKYYITIPLQV